MSEYRRKGWHPDPYGIHKERFYYLDNCPGRLVRNDDRVEFYDDIPAWAAPTQLEEVAPVTRVQPVATSLPQIAAPAPPPSTAMPAPAPSTVGAASAGGPGSQVAVPLIAAVASPAVAPTPSTTGPPAGTSVLPPPITVPSDGTNGNGNGTNGNGTNANGTNGNGAYGTGAYGTNGAGVQVAPAPLAPPEVAGGDYFPGEPVPWRVRTGEKLAALRGRVPTGKVRRPSRGTWIALVTGAFVAALVAGFFVFLGSGSNSSPVQQNGHPIVPSNFLNGGRGEGAAPSTPAPTTTPTAGSTAKALQALAGPPGPGWSVVQTFGQSADSLTAISCPSSTECYAVGETAFKTGMVLTSSDGGATWSQRSVPAGVGALAAISCPAAGTCTAVGGTTVISTTNGGATWTEATVGQSSLTAVSCPSTAECVVAGEDPPVVKGCQPGATYTTTDGGQAWTDSPTPCFVPTAVDCTTTDQCVVVGTHTNGVTQIGEIRHSGDGAKTWQVEYVLSQGNTQLNAVSCPTVRVCIAVGNSPTQSVLRTGNGGITWARQIPRGATTQSYFLAVDCSSETDCQAAGTGVPVGTSDSGATWSAVGSSNDITKILGISCPTTSACVGVAWDSLAVPATIKFS